MPSERYQRIHALAMHLARVCGDTAQSEVQGPDVMQLRTADAKHSWGHAAYVRSRHGLLHEMTNGQFLAYMSAHEGVIHDAHATLHRILVDEEQSSAMVFMSIFLHVQGEGEPLEQDMIWLMEADEAAEKMTRTVEYVDAVTANRLAAAFDRAGKPTLGVEGSQRIAYA